MKERIESMLKLMEDAKKGEAAPPGLKQLLRDLNAPTGLPLKIRVIRQYLNDRLNDYANEL